MSRSSRQVSVERYPNAISAEGARGMEYNAFGDYTQVNGWASRSASD